MKSGDTTRGHRILGSKSPVLIAGDDDQALYVNLKYASPDFIREIAADGTHETFELPFCSRCTEVVVAAVNEALSKAQKAAADKLGPLTGGMKLPGMP